MDFMKITLTAVLCFSNLAFSSEASDSIAEMELELEILGENLNSYKKRLKNYKNAKQVEAFQLFVSEYGNFAPPPTISQIFNFAARVDSTWKLEALLVVLDAKINPLTMSKDIIAKGGSQKSIDALREKIKKTAPKTNAAQGAPKNTTPVQKADALKGIGLDPPEKISFFLKPTTSFPKMEKIRTIVMMIGDTLKAEDGGKFTVIDNLGILQKKARLLLVERNDKGGKFLMLAPVDGSSEHRDFIKKKVKTPKPIDGGEDYIIFEPDALWKEIQTAAQNLQPVEDKPYYTGTKPVKKGTEKITSFAGRTFTGGDKFKLEDGTKYEVVKYLAKGKRGKVYIIKDSKTGQNYALKIAIDKSADTLDSFSREMDKVKGYEKLGLPHAKVFKDGKDFFVKELIDGQQGDVFMLDWADQHFPENRPEIKALQEFVFKVAESGAYVSDLNRRNLIYSPSRGEWVIIDSGSIKYKQKFENILFTYMESIHRNWGRDLLKIHSFMQSWGCNILNAKMSQKLGNTKGLKDIQYPNGYPN